MKPVKIVLFIISLSAYSIFPADTLESFDRENNQSAFLSPMPNFNEQEREELFGDYFRLQDDTPEGQIDQFAFIPLVPDLTPEEYEELFGNSVDNQPETQTQVDQIPALSRKHARTSATIAESPDKRSRSQYVWTWTCQECGANFRTRALFREHARRTAHSATSVEEAKQRITH